MQRWILALVAISVFPLHAGATTMWWNTNATGVNQLGDPFDEFWDGSTNWIRDLGGGAHEHGVPTPEEETYISTTATIPSIVPAVIDDWMSGEERARAGDVYIGGWDSSHDAEHGDPKDHSGVLELRGGELDIGRNYLRVGYGGARGLLDQSGGLLAVGLSVSMAWLSPDSVGEFRLSEGEVDAILNVGTFGTGYFDMTGGHLLPYRPLAVGRGYPDDRGLPTPAVGLMNQLGGKAEVTSFEIGVIPESVGTVGIRGPRYDPETDEGTLVVASRLISGVEGWGAVTQTGGTVRVNRRVVLGEFPGSAGRYTISGGTLEQRISEFGLYVGIEGTGFLTVIGRQGRIEIAGGYTQNGDSTVTFWIGDDGVTPIAVEGHARFADGARLQMRTADGYTPSRHDRFPLLTAAGGIHYGKIQLIGPERGLWIVDAASPNTFEVVYTAGDFDVDGLSDLADNCQVTGNPDQWDSDRDGYGDLCDSDYNNDGVVGNSDLALLSRHLGTQAGDPDYDRVYDCNGDHTVSIVDTQCVMERFGHPPGPSRLECAGTVPCAAP